jgi:hypothetical protein
VVDAAVVPDGCENVSSTASPPTEAVSLTKIVWILPLESDLQIMVLHNQRLEPLERVLALAVAQPIDLLDVVANGEDGLPSSHRVGADDWVNGLEDVAHVLGRTPLLAVELKAVLLGRGGETWLRVCCV